MIKFDYKNLMTCMIIYPDEFEKFSKYDTPLNPTAVYVSYMLTKKKLIEILNECNAINNFPAPAGLQRGIICDNSFNIKLIECNTNKFRDDVYIQGYNPTLIECRNKVIVWGQNILNSYSKCGVLIPNIDNWFCYNYIFCSNKKKSFNRYEEMLLNQRIIGNSDIFKFSESLTYYRAPI